MLLSDLFANLSYGPLSNLSVGMEGTGAVHPDKEDKIIHHINQGLLKLYGRFLIKTGEVVVRAYDGKTMYPLEKKYADSDSTVVDQKFIADTPQYPFTADIIKILQIYDEEGEPIPLNDEHDEDSLFTPTVRTLQIPEPMTGDSYFLMYQARHPIIVQDDYSQEISLPFALEAALEAYVGHKVLGPMAGKENSAKALELLQTYEAICREAETNDLAGTSLVTTPNKFEERGFV